VVVVATSDAYRTGAPRPLATISSDARTDSLVRPTVGNFLRARWRIADEITIAAIVVVVVVIVAACWIARS
jgi:hypothetical protein